MKEWGWNGKEGLERVREGSDRKAKGRGKLSSPKFSNVGTSWEAIKRERYCTIVSMGWFPLLVVAKL